MFKCKNFTHHFGFETQNPIQKGMHLAISSIYFICLSCYCHTNRIRMYVPPFYCVWVLRSCLFYCCSFVALHFISFCNHDYDSKYAAYKCKRASDYVGKVSLFLFEKWLFAFDYEIVFEVSRRMLDCTLFCNVEM